MKKIFTKAKIDPTAIVSAPKIKNHDEKSSSLGSLMLITVKNRKPPKHKKEMSNPKIQSSFRII